MNNRRNRHNVSMAAAGVFGLVALGFLLIGAIVIGGLVASLYAHAHPEYKTCAVTSKYEANSNDSTKYRIETENCGVLEVQDSILAWQFDAADRYAQLKNGESYEMTLVGWRVPFLSMFPNAVEIKNV